MHLVKFRKVYSLAAAALLLSHLLGLFFCGDSDCLQGSAANDCAALVCSLLGKHTAPAAATDGNPNDNCQCFCHQLIHLPKLALYVAPFDATAHYPLELPHFLPTPVCNIDHPPSA